MTPPPRSKTQHEDERVLTASRTDQRINELVAPDRMRLSSLEKDLEVIRREQSLDKQNHNTNRDATNQLVYEMKDLTVKLQELKTDHAVTRTNVQKVEGDVALVKQQLNQQDVVLKDISRSQSETEKSLLGIKTSQEVLAKQKDQIFPLWITIVGGIVMLISGYFFAMLTSHR